MNIFVSRYPWCRTRKVIHSTQNVRFTLNYIDYASNHWIICIVQDISFDNEPTLHTIHTYTYTNNESCAILKNCLHFDIKRLSRWEIMNDNDTPFRHSYKNIPTSLMLLPTCLNPRHPHSPPTYPRAPPFWPGPNEANALWRIHPAWWPVGSTGLGGSVGGPKGYGPGGRLGGPEGIVENSLFSRKEGQDRIYYTGIREYPYLEIPLNDQWTRLPLNSWPNLLWILD